MKLSIVSVKGAGDLKSERLLLKVRDDTDVGDYFVADTAYQGEGQVSSKLRNVLWLPDREVGRGDLVVIYTKSGADKSRDNEGGGRTHFLYWGLKSAIWDREDVAAVLFYIGEWQAIKVES